MNRRYKVILTILGISISAGLGYMVFGERGIIAYYKLRKEIELEQKQIKELEEEINHIQAKIDSWKSDEFHQEKFARQDLQMGKPDEQVYVLTNTNQKT
jgi:cell division protein FtsB